jgi:hypothetical protein
MTKIVTDYGYEQQPDVWDWPLQTFFNWLRCHVQRREHVANHADPTVVVVYTAGRWLRLVASWGVEARVTTRGGTWHSYNAQPFVWLLDGLEAAEMRQEVL